MAIDNTLRILTPEEKRISSLFLYPFLQPKNKRYMVAQRVSKQDKNLHIPKIPEFARAYKQCSRMPDL